MTNRHWSKMSICLSYYQNNSKSSLICPSIGVGVYHGCLSMCSSFHISRIRRAGFRGGVVRDLSCYRAYLCSCRRYDIPDFALSALSIYSLWPPYRSTGLLSRQNLPWDRQRRLGRQWRAVLFFCFSAFWWLPWRAYCMRLCRCCSCCSHYCHH